MKYFAWFLAWFCFGNAVVNALEYVKSGSAESLVIVFVMVICWGINLRSYRYWATQ